jgi:aspartyl-tRNA(Asn)/glutamyl-tRNA(Gln) amidotransferase subunit B
MEKSWVKEYLEKKKVNFTFVEHEPAYKPVDSARLRNVSLQQIAKALLYIIGKEPVLLILPGDLTVDDEKLKKLFKADEVKLASEEQVKKFTSCIVGLVPPTIEKIKKIIDSALLINREVSFNAGIATAGIIISKDDLLKVLDNYEIKDISAGRDVVIGLEIHTELATDSKLFCSCSTHGDETPNSRCCPVCLGHPGSKPVLNKKAVEFALKLCLALNCKISPELVFSRKSYFYPDMAKNYQISQYELPLGLNGKLKLDSGKNVSIKRVHMEEDPASLVHPSGMQQSAYVLVDYNRSGDPLVEIVTEPDLTSPAEARDFMKQLITVLEYLDIFDVDRCIIKADANISIKESGYKRVEIKNITGFKEIERALNYEVERQKHNTKEIFLETRAWDAEKGITFSLRKKEAEEEYGYIIDPDLVSLEIKKEFIEKTKKEMPELAEEKLKKFTDKHGIAEETAKILSKDKELAEMFEAVSKHVNPDLAANWVRRELPRVLNYQKKALKDSGITSKHMIDLLKAIETNKITARIGQKIIEKLSEAVFDVHEYIQKESLAAVSDLNELEKIAKETLDECKEAVEKFKKGEEKAFHFIVGQVMKKTKGKAKPDIVHNILKKLIG